MRHLTTAEAARIIGITRQAVWRAICRGDIEAERVGSIWCVSRASARAYRPRRSFRQPRKRR